MFVCTLHFDESAIYNTLANKRLRDAAVPILLVKEPKKIYQGRGIPIKPVKETPEKQLTIIINPKSAAENADTHHRPLSNDNRDKKLSDTHKLLAPRRMGSCVKLLDENFEFNTAALEYLSDTSTHYLVVAVIGMQGVGKSMILNLIAQSKPISNLGENIVHALFDDEKRTIERANYDSDEKNYKSDKAKDEGDDLFKFKIQSFNHITSNKSCTKGVDMYVTEDRMILLDCQALWSLTSDDSHANSMTFRNPDPIVGGLQVASYLMSISHVVITVMDWFTDLVLLRYLHAADMLRPTLSAPPVATADGEAPVHNAENHPHLLLICNKCAANQASSETLSELQDTFRKTFQKSKLRVSTGLHLYRDVNKNIGRRAHNNKRGSGEKSINMFMLPEILDSTHGTRKYFNDYTFEQIASRLRECVMSASRHPINNVPNLSERGWLHFANKAWDTTRKCPFFMEYESFLP